MPDRTTPAPSLNDIQCATDTLSRLTDYLRDNPDPAKALTLVEPLLDEYTGIPVQLADTLRALARTLQNHSAASRTAETDLLIAELRTAAWEQSDQHLLHYVLDGLRNHFDSTPSDAPGSGRCR
ncbi:hypothetical protein ACFWYA_06095 [Streptomyces sp. NPDC059011]|uniref:hypothetical protein n=1 Tax=unclassified Streptomyces TaxID=2593676 RepID=UPI0036C276D1